jgi:hypothetical protein
MKPKNLLVLFAVAGLLAAAFAGPRPDKATSAQKCARHQQMLDSLRMLRAKERGLALPQGIDATKVSRQVRHVQRPGTPLMPQSPFTDPEFMPAPTVAYYGDPPSPNIEQMPSVASDGTNYLVTWKDNRDDGYWNVYGARVAPNGDLLDPDGFQISLTTTSNSTYPPSAAFDDDASFLVVWGDGSDIYGALVSTDGRVTKSDIPISTVGDDNYAPKVAFNGTKYLVVWEDWTDLSYPQIHGTLVTTDGTPGADIEIQIDPDCYSFAASVASDNSDFLVVWQDDYSGVIGGRVVYNNGTMGAVKPISTTGYNESPATAFDGTTYLVVWDDYFNIHGTLVNKSGEPGEDIAISPTQGWQYTSAVAFDGTDFLVVWKEHANGEIDGCFVTTTGYPGVAFPIIPPQAEATGWPAVTFGSGQAFVTCHAATSRVAGINYELKERIWARLQPQASISYDASTKLIIRPVASYLTAESWSIPPKVTVKNYGPQPTGDFQVTVTIRPGTYTSTKPVLSLDQNETCAVEFDDAAFDLATQGSNLYTVKCSTDMNGELKDDHAANDAQVAYFQGCDFIDFADISADSGLALGGDWGLGAPACPPWILPPMDIAAWGNQLDASYDNSENGYLTSPTYKASQANPTIAFQHNFSTESLADGGNFSYKIGTGTWSLLEPSVGFPYNGTVAALGGRGWSGWSGSQSGWRQSVFVLDSVDEDDEFQVRWRFASGTTGNYKGWLIDEIAGIHCARVPPPPPSGPGSMIDTLSVYPNLVRGPAQVNYTLVKDCNVTINLYDASGRLAARVPTSGFKKGKNTARLDAGGLASGVYFVKVKGETDTKTTKVIIE